MKKYLLLVVSVFVQLEARADVVNFKRVLKDSTTQVLLELNDKTVFCTERGYSSVQLKVSVPELDDIAHFNHRVEGEGQPCITGGRCSTKWNPSVIIDPNERFTLAAIRVILNEHLYIDETLRTCSRLLIENVETQIRGGKFMHQIFGEQKVADYEKCLRVTKI